VLVLGAGASLASKFQLPVMRGFFGPGLDDFPALTAFLASFYRDRDADGFNVEEVLAYLDLARTRYGLLEPDPVRRTSNRSEALYRECIEYVKRRLKINLNVPCDLHVGLFQKLANRDTVVTLNYDLIADNSLLAIEPQIQGHVDQNYRLAKLNTLLQNERFMGGSPPSLLDREDEIGFYFKLHGSLDWLYCPIAGCPYNTNLFPAGIARLAEGQAEGRPCRACGTPIEVFLVPPVAAKRIQGTSRLSLLWGLAARELSMSCRWIIAGVSLAPTDFELRWLLKSSLEHRGSDRTDLIVVNPNRCDADRIAAFLRPPQGEIQRLDSLETLIQTWPLDYCAR